MHDIQQMLEEKRAKARLGGGEKRIAAQHSKGIQCQRQANAVRHLPQQQPAPARQNPRVPLN